LTIGGFDRIYQQVDPMKLAEFERAVSIAKQYGLRLSEKSRNLKGDTIDNLITNYPSHGFVIDRQEASTLFSRVRAPDADEQTILNCFLRKAIGALMDENREVPLIEVLSVDLSDVEGTGTKRGKNDRRTGRSRRMPAPIATANGQRSDGTNNAQTTSGSTETRQSSANSEATERATSRSTRGRK
jgi:hypothetical protein